MYSETLELRSPASAVRNNNAFLIAYALASAERTVVTKEISGADGFCIVLNTAEMGRPLGADNDTRYWVRLVLEPVRYSAEGTSLDALLPELINAGKDCSSTCSAPPSKRWPFRNF